MLGVAGAAVDDGVDVVVLAGGGVSSRWIKYAVSPVKHRAVAATIVGTAGLGGNFMGLRVSIVANTLGPYGSLH